MLQLHLDRAKETDKVLDIELSFLSTGITTLAYGQKTIKEMILCTKVFCDFTAVSEKELRTLKEGGPSYAWKSGNTAIYLAILI